MRNFRFGKSFLVNKSILTFGKITLEETARSQPRTFNKHKIQIL